MRKNAEHIFRAGVEWVLPDKLIRSVLRYEDGQLVIANQSVYPFRRLYLLAAGKAAALMAQAAEDILGDEIAGGHVVTKYGHGLPLKRLTITEAGHPLPDAAGIEAAQHLLAIAQQAEEGDVLLCLFSGGASALMTDLPEGATLDELIVANDLLVKSGAAISEINSLRKHLSCMKGGQLAAAAAPATVVSLILSDVVGDDPGVIASGPTAPDESTFADALAVIETYGLTHRFPASLLTHLHNGVSGLLPETPKPGNAVFSNVHNHIIGNNRHALVGAAQQAEALGFEARIITDSLQGDTCDAAECILQTIRSNAETEHEKPLCLLFGGETTLKVTGSGLGGRNQHLALCLATNVEQGKEITILCAGTDGTDGPTDAAGAVVDSRTLSDAREFQIEAANYLSRFDSYHFFELAGGHIITGNTRTNVMDMVVVLI